MCYNLKSLIRQQIDRAILNLEESLKKRREQRKATEDSEVSKNAQAPKIAAQGGPSVLV